MSGRLQLLDGHSVSTPRRRLLFDNSSDVTDELRSITSMQEFDLSLSGKYSGTVPFTPLSMNPTSRFSVPSPVSSEISRHSSSAAPLIMHTPPPGSPHPTSNRPPPTPTPNKVAPLTHQYKKSSQNKDVFSPIKENQRKHRISAHQIDAPSAITFKSNFNPFSPQRPSSRGITLPAADSKENMISRFVSDFEILNELGRGSYGVVYKCLNRTDGWIYAVKKITYKNTSIRNSMLKEAFALVALGQHPNIVRYYSSWEHSNPETTVRAHLYIQCEYLEGGSLRSQLTKGQAFNQNELTRILRHIGEALVHMHALNMAHGDIKPENILVSTSDINENTLYKIGDLGQINSCGDGKYLAPEMLDLEDDEGGATPMATDTLSKADIYSLGVTIFEIASLQIINSKVDGNIVDLSQSFHGDIFTLDFEYLLKAMTNSLSYDRPLANELIRHPLLLNSVELQLLDAQRRAAAYEMELIETKARIVELERLLQQRQPLGFPFSS